MKYFRKFGSEQRFIFRRRIRDNTRRIKNNKASGAPSVVNEFLKYGGCEVGDESLKTINMLFAKGEVTSDVRKIFN